MTRHLQLVLAVFASLALGTLAFVVLTRASYPFELEWQEGGMLAHVARVRAGEPLYARPALEFIAFPYPPLYTWTAALLASAVGEGFLALRVVSCVATLATLALLYRLAQRGERDPLAGLLAAGLFAAAFRFCGAWYDVGRVDSLALALLLAGVWLAVERRGVRAAALAGFVVFLAFLTKQIALVPAALMTLALVRRSRREALAFGGTFVVLGLVSTLALDLSSGGAYRSYVFEMLGGPPLVASELLGFWRTSVLAFAPALVLGAWQSWRARESGVGSEHDGLVFGAALTGLVLAAWLARLHVGAYDNVFMPACAAFALFAAPALTRALRQGGVTAFAACALGVAQFALLMYDPREQLPAYADEAAGHALLERVRGIDGDVWMPAQGYLAQRAGKHGSAHAMAVTDLLQGPDRAAAQAFVSELTRALAERRFAAVILDQAWDADLPELAQGYTRVTWRYPDEHTFVPVTGAPRRPLYFYVRR